MNRYTVSRRAQQDLDEIYQPTTAGVRIARVLHGARDVRSAFRE